MKLLVVQMLRLSESLRMKEMVELLRLCLLEARSFLLKPLFVGRAEEGLRRRLLVVVDVGVLRMRWVLRVRGKVLNARRIREVSRSRSRIGRWVVVGFEHVAGVDLDVYGFGAVLEMRRRMRTVAVCVRVAMTGLRDRDHR